MLGQLNHWILIAGTAADALLLLRILQLRLQKTYTFITLAALVTLFFDIVGLWLGLDSRENLYVILYSRFLLLFVFPAAAYDVWEEARPQIEPIRRFAGVRMIGSLAIASLFGLIIAAVTGSEEGRDTLLGTFAIIVWASAATSSLAFLWSVRRLARAQNVALPANTLVWLLYYKLLLAGEVVWCFLLITGEIINATALDSLQLVLNLYEIAVTLWCVWRLRSIASGVPTAPENVSS
ncbi:MAG TPA: hypothetical protein VKX25_03790 [Bryobacteraceae bacterium]|jgi:hypothetical protein|nr:hypothetical protein [Bryobacteraceae bacterium]